MDKIATIIVSLLLALGVSVGTGVAMTHAIEQDLAKAAGSNSFGALAGPDIASPYLKWGSLVTNNGANVMKTATTTLCSYGPFAATSTLQSFAAQITLGTTTAAVIDLATSTTPSATSTSDVLLRRTVASGAQGFFSWDQTASNQNVVGKGLYLLVMTEGAGLSGYTYSGTCQEQHQTMGAF